MLPAIQEHPILAFLRQLPIRDQARALGVLLVGAPGAGKTILESLLLLRDVLLGYPGVVLDPLGTLSEAFVFRLFPLLSAFPTGEDDLLWQHLRYIPLGGASSTFPIYHVRQGESLWDASMRLITVLERANPQLATSPLTWPAARRLALNAGVLLTALSFGLDKVEDLLFNTIEWQQSGRFQEAINRNLQATDAVSYFRNYYLPLPRAEKSRLAGTFLDQVLPLTDPTLRAIFAGSSTPGIDWEEVEALGQIVILSFKAIRNPASRLFAMQWLLESLLAHLKARGRRETPFVLTIDEFANLTAQGTADNKPLAEFFDELLAQFARNSRVFVTAALQSLDQVDPRLQQTLLRMATIITGRAGTPREARLLADVLFRKDINRVQHQKKVFGKVDVPPLPRGYSSAAYYRDMQLSSQWQSPYFPYYVLETEPMYLGLDLQEEEAAGKIQALSALEFLIRPAVSEGTVSQEVMSFSIGDALRDPVTGQVQFPAPDDAALLAEMQEELAKRSGVPMQQIQALQAERLDAGTSKKEPAPQTKEPASPQSTTEEGSLLDGAHPQPQPVKTTPSRPTLDEQQIAFLRYITEQPETPVSAVYKAVGVSGWKGEKLRDALKQQGLLQEVAVRREGAGRPTKFFIPTFTAFELLRREPPNGRGGAIHRYLQQVVVAGATRKGYSAQVEKAIGNGAIVDVHLEREGVRIACECVVVSKPQREIGHIKNALNADYNKVFVVFAEQRTLERTQEAMNGEFSVEELSKVSLLPLSKLSGVG
jgi:hypothetical protein